MKLKKLVVGVCALGMLPFAHATGPDISAVTTGCTDTATAVVAGAAIVIPAAVGLMAIKFGGRWCVKVFKSFAS